ncbi:hypothetical protein [Cytobacillus dafuensis]|uniref:Uncharacterized protein n=1 Tax=Cytobacillus dafuensis TaxID=1742359 RepID=A0A5B8YZZ4_CYTDA|nr:hypothetical protein [Cytobacillus dafuensis]QED46007.1 hypothetical protein FSZ17_01075 [Cytobacillus dafuensis]
MRKVLFIASLVCFVLGILHVFGFSYSIIDFMYNDITLDTDTEKSINKITTRVVEGLTVMAFSLTGFLVWEQRSHESQEAAFKESLVSLLDEIKEQQGKTQSQNAKLEEKIDEAKHKILSYNGKKNKKHSK